jgi:hypothetical protein
MQAQNAKDGLCLVRTSPEDSNLAGGRVQSLKQETKDIQNEITGQYFEAWRERTGFVRYSTYDGPVRRGGGGRQ